jgi:hypothetical protein
LAGISGIAEGKISGRRTAWLGREDSNLRMVESKSRNFPLFINAHSEKLQKFTSISLNWLAGYSERQSPSTFYLNRATLFLEI